MWVVAFSLRLVVSTVETYRGRDRDFSTRRDRLLKVSRSTFKSVEIESLDQDLDKNRDFRA
jgi:hypothetical protein